jgi:hypothetical protein
MKKLLLLFMLAALAGMGYAAMSFYSFGQSAATYTELTSPTVLHGTAVDDAMSAVTEIGFSFVLDGVSYTQFKANSNGFITLNTASTASLSNALASNILILGALWDDLKTNDTDAGVSYQLTGTIPYRVLKVQYKNLKWYYNASPVNLVNFQICLYETTNLVEFVYGTMGAAPGASASASCGISGAVAGNYVSVTPATPVATVSSIAEFTAINATHVPYMTGNKYTFTPPDPNVPPNQAALVYPPLGNTVPVSVIMQWNPTGGVIEGYKLFLGTDGGGTVTPTNLVNGTNLGLVTSYQHPGFLAGGATYYWKIVPWNTLGGDAVGCPIWNFITSTPMTGTKIIGTTTPYDYATFTEAITALNTAGVGTGGVTFQVQDGTYAENPPAIATSGSSVNPIIFQAATGANPVLVPAGGTGTFGFKLDGADWVTFDNIDINGPNTLIYGYWLANGAQNNTVKNCSITVPYGSSTNYGIYSYYSVGNPNSYLSILNNNIVSPYTGIYIYHASGTEAQNLNLQGNTLTGIRNYGIYVYYAQNSVIQYNNIGFYSGGTTSYYGIYLYGSTSTFNVHHNTISGGYTSSYVYGIEIYYPTATIDHNTVTNLYSTGSSSWYGLYDYYGSGTWTNNTISNITNTGTASFYGLYASYAGTSTWYNNSVSGVTITTGTLYAAYCAGVASYSFHDNEIQNLNSTGNIYGHYVSSGTANSIYNNKYNNFSYNGTSTLTVNGIYITGGTTNNIYNNWVYDLRNAAGTTAPQIRGIGIAGGTADNIWNNTVYLNTSATAAAFSPTALYVSSGTTIDLKNNIFVNRSTPGATGRTVAFWKTTAGVGNLAPTSDKNIYYAGVPGASNLIGYFNSVAYQTLDDYKAMTATVDLGSYSEDVPFVSMARIIDLHIDPSVPTRVEGNAIVIQPPVTTDIDGDPRDASTPDIGADEGEFTGFDLPPGPPNLISPAMDATDVSITVNLTWSASAEGGTPEWYDIYFGTSESVLNYVDTVTNTSYPTSLDYSTEYWWRIEANRSGYDPVPSAVGHFTTMADPTVTVFPLIESFDGTTFAPLNWTNVKTAGTSTPGIWDRQTTGTSPACSPHSGAAMARYNSYSISSGGKAELITPPLAVPSGSGYRVKFWMFRDNGYSTYNLEVLNVYVNTSPTSVGGTLLGTISRYYGFAPVVPTANLWYEYEFNFTGAAANSYVVFEAVSQFGNNMFIDDVDIREIPSLPDIGILPNPLNFGQQYTTNAPVTLPVTITNTGGGTGTLDITAITYSGGAPYTVTIPDPQLPWNLAMGESGTFNVTFDPSVAGTFDNRQITVVSNLAASPHTVVVNGSSVDISGGYHVANSFQTTLSSYPTYYWIDISATGTELTGLTDDSYTATPIPLGMTFPFFGTSYTDVYVSSNGHLTFGAGSSSLSNVGIPVTGTPNNMIAWFWDDMNPGDADITDDWIKYQTVDGNFVITFYKLPKYYSSVDPDMWITAQVILFPTGKIKMQYAAMGATMLLNSYTVGIENSDGTLGVQYHFDATGLSVFGPAGEPMAVAFGTGDLSDVITTPDTPANMAIAMSGTDVQISWDAVAGASGYKVYGSNDPYAAQPWTLVTTVLSPATSTTITPAEAFQFYYVTAYAGTRESVIPIRSKRK